MLVLWVYVKVTYISLSEILKFLIRGFEFPILLGIDVYLTSGVFYLYNCYYRRW